MMSRTQISLDPGLLRRARSRAAEYGVSLAEYIRRLLTADLAESHPAVDRSLVFNLGNSGGSDIARHKDRMLGEAVQAERAPVGPDR